MTTKLKILIVDDSIVYRRVINKAIVPIAEADIIHTAATAELALEKMSHHKYDVILLDNIMPGMNGLEVLQIIKKKPDPPEVVMISESGGSNGEITLKALEYGALDFIVKPKGDSPEENLRKLRSQLQGLLTQIASEVAKKDAAAETGKDAVKRPAVKEPAPQQEIIRHPKLKQIDFVTIASSTGGPVALRKLLQAINKPLGKPAFIVQHMPAGFTALMANSLTNESIHTVKEAEDGDTVGSDIIYLAPGGLHMKIKQRPAGKRIIELESSPTVNGVRPAADVFFNSIAAECPGIGVLAVVLTGMGSDGTKGIQAMKEKCSVHAIAQSEKTSVVYGMPKSLVTAGLADEIRDLNIIGSRIEKLLTL